VQLDILAMNERIRNESAFVQPILGQIEKVIVGQKHMLERLLVSLL
jgi:MoxR-like ATPase